MATVFELKGEASVALPILVSVPHCGIDFPDEVAAALRPPFVRDPQDTDWRVHELYGFAPEMGVALLAARFSRYVIDLNRDPADRPLYGDGRRETSLVPLNSFGGEPLYDTPPDRGEVVRRTDLYFHPYHQEIRRVLGALKARFGVAVLFDAHSIARHVPSIRPEPFSDLILGDQRGTTAGPVGVAARRVLAAGPYPFTDNDPFRGGFITRHFGRPSEGIFALQLEMSQDVYLRSDRQLDGMKLKTLQPFLRSLLQGVGEAALAWAGENQR